MAGAVAGAVVGLARMSPALSFFSPFGILLGLGVALQLWLPEAEYTIRWYDPRSGGELQSGSIATLSGPGHVSLGAPPREPERDWVALVELAGPPPNAVPPPR